MNGKPGGIDNLVFPKPVSDVFIRIFYTPLQEVVAFFITSFVLRIKNKRIQIVAGMVKLGAYAFGKFYFTQVFITDTAVYFPSRYWAKISKYSSSVVW